MAATIISAMAIIERIDIYPEKRKDGCWIRNIVFNFPVPISGKDIRELPLENSTILETVCLLSKLSGAKNTIDVKVDMAELDVTSGETKATYEEIKAYVLENSGLQVSSLYIAQVKRKCGIIGRENYNKSKSEESKQLRCPEDKRKAIVKALKHFGMI